LEQPKYRTEGCLPASLAASSRLKKPRKDGGGEEKKERRNDGGREKRIARRSQTAFGFYRRSKKREKNEHTLSII